VLGRVWGKSEQAEDGAVRGEKEEGGWRCGHLGRQVICRGLGMEIGSNEDKDV
jgi:hypothetical protein